MVGTHGSRAVPSSRLRDMDEDPEHSPELVKRTLDEVNQFLGPTFILLSSDSPTWWRDFCASAHRITFTSPSWAIALSSTRSAPTAATRSSPPVRAANGHRQVTGGGGENSQPRPSTIPQKYRSLIPRNADGQEPCLRFFGGGMCYGGLAGRARGTVVHSGESPVVFQGGHSTDAFSEVAVTLAGESPHKRGHSVDAAPPHNPLLQQQTPPSGENLAPIARAILPKEQATPYLARVEQPGRAPPTAADLAALTYNGKQRERLWEAIRRSSVAIAFKRVGVDLPSVSLVHHNQLPEGEFQLNKPLQAAMSKYIRRARPSLQKFVELVRCQTPGDYRPNKAILPGLLQRTCQGYPKLDALLRIANEGARIDLIRPLPKQDGFPRNHPSAVERINVLRRNIRKEQDLWRCLVVDADIITIWPEIFISPFGVVDKGEGDPSTTGRVIHDLSSPDGESVNHLTDRSTVTDVTFEHCSSIAREISKCTRQNPGADVKVMAGDIASAYRNACTHSACVFACAGHIPEDNAIIIDLSAAFGWAGSAGTYSVLGGAVAFIHGSSPDAAHPNRYYNYHWVDDHVNVTADIGSCCADVERSLRFAVAAVMGPSAVNEDKFSP
ncbi:hypothetical protein PPTG_23382 [Phytophthora nicotianae INRA-310]|uniref:Uncharacterized protein n=1 Tax=Phytophthora nicotianae (strain INRA-310) TaxID=761204 RepID=W2Q1M9_PHYN3|nr:hypothetical protein PPTG_23382 [Phytophthora nicotianae INRA-310]ETN06449.1 hypothetical protein PPTG_23382 [Phytophthora nicotianae INRA-310]